MCTSELNCTIPRHVYGGILANKTTKPVLCTIHYLDANHHHFVELVSVTIDGGSQACIPEREYQPSSEVQFTCRKVVSRIDVQIDGEVFSLEQPFDGVSCPVTEWKFDIYADQIISINPNQSPILNKAMITSH